MTLDRGDYFVVIRGKRLNFVPMNGPFSFSGSFDLDEEKKEFYDMSYVDKFVFQCLNEKVDTETDKVILYKCVFPYAPHGACGVLTLQDGIEIFPIGQKDAKNFIEEYNKVYTSFKEGRKENLSSDFFSSTGQI